MRSPTLARQGAVAGDDDGGRAGLGLLFLDLWGSRFLWLVFDWSRSGSFERRVRFNTPIVENQVAARYRDGVLSAPHAVAVVGGLVVVDSAPPVERRAGNRQRVEAR